MKFVKMNNSNNNQLILVTGGSGFTASHCIIALLNAGFKVRAALRNLKKSEDVEAMIFTLTWDLKICRIFLMRLRRRSDILHRN